MNRFALVALLTLIFNPAFAQTASNGLSVTDAWSRATNTMHGNAVVYLTITDTGAPDTLTAASTPVATKAQLHENKHDNGVMEMRPVASLPVDKDHPITLAPGGYHMMLEGVQQELKVGDTFPLTLIFAHAGAVTTTVKVQKAGSSKAESTMPGMDMDGMSGMDMSGMGH
jgi:copper(I)-binding protein